MTAPADAVITVVGIGEDGWAGLSPAAAKAVESADVVVGSARQLELVDGHVRATETWTSPLAGAVPGLLDRHPGRSVTVLASGDPSYFGVAATLVRQFGAGAVRVLPAPSAVSLAAARLGWPLAEVQVLSAVGRPLEALHRVLHDGVRVLLLVSESDAAARTGALLRAAGFGSSGVTVLERLGGPLERVEVVTTGFDGRHDPLAVLALDLRGPGLSLTAGLPDDAFDSDGALTKREVRAVTMSSLAPQPGQLLWDVGAGSGSIAIEWMRSHPSCRAVAIEPRADRRARLERNAVRLGVPGLEVVKRSAPAALTGLPEPDAIFIGGGLTAEGVLDRCLLALRPGGRLVANAVTVETETILARQHAALGGDLVRLAVARAEPLGGFQTFRPAIAVTQWTYVTP